MRLLRIVLAAIAYLAMLAVFVVPSVAIGWRLGWITRVQIVPAILAGSFALLAGLAVFVALFGRLYCSTICPLGVSQDVVRSVARICRVPAIRLRGGRTLAIVRVVCLAVFVVLCCVGLTGLVEPYGIFGRFLTTCVLRVGDPAVLVTIWALALFVAIVGAGACVPRLWCHTVCPVGTFLGFFSRFALFRVRIDASKCVACGQCAKKCETGALTPDESRAIKIDVSRCVLCGNCRGACKNGALSLVVGGW